MTADAKSYARDIGVLAIGGFILAIGYGLACIAAGLALSRVIGGPMAFAGLAVLHLIVGAIALGLIMRRMKRLQLMQGTKDEVSRSISVLSTSTYALTWPFTTKKSSASATPRSTPPSSRKTTKARRSPFTEVAGRRRRSNDRASASSARWWRCATRSRGERTGAAGSRAVPRCFWARPWYSGFVWGYRQRGGRASHRR